MPRPAEPDREQPAEEVNLPWLQAVHERAVMKTSGLGPDHAAEAHAHPVQAPDEQADQAQTPEHVEPSEPVEKAAPGEAAPESTAPAGPEAVPEQAAAPAAEEARQGEEEPSPPPQDASEPPPEWVVGILEPGAASGPTEEEQYEPEELQHIMPWLGAAGGEGGENRLPPWLSGVTVQETLQTRGEPPEGAQPPTPVSDADLEGLEPFVPPEMQEGAAKPGEAGAEGRSATPTPAEKVPDWLENISAVAPSAEKRTEEQPRADRFTPITRSVLGPTETLGQPIAREVPVRPPRPGAVETLAALLESPAGPGVAEEGGAGAQPLATSALSLATEVRTQARSPVIRWLLPDGIIYLVILAALLAVLLVRPPFGQVNAPIAADAIQFYNAIDSSPRDKPALVVFDWDASRSAEMAALSSAVVNHLMSRHIRFVTLSTVAQGPGFAQQITNDAANDTGANYGYVYGRDYLVLGYLPGNEAALRSLSSDFTGVLPIDFVNSQPVAGTEIAQGGKISSLSDFSMIIDLAADETTLRSWIEQVSSRTGLPVLAAVPQALEPLARPYKNVRGAGLQAVVSGQTGAMQYIEQMKAHGQGNAGYSTTYLSDRLNAQSVAQILVALAILAAFINLATRRIFRR